MCNFNKIPTGLSVGRQGFGKVCAGVLVEGTKTRITGKSISAKVRVGWPGG